MDSAVVDSAALGAWASIRGYFTPATLFLVLNLVIGTIALTSRSQQRRRRENLHDYAHNHEPAALLDPQHQQEYHYYQHPQHQYAMPPPPAVPPLARTSSVLDRLRSIGLYRFRSGDFPPEYGASAAANHHDHASFAPVEEEDQATAKQYARSRSEPVAPAREERMNKSGTGTEVVRNKSQAAARTPATRVVHAVARDHAETVHARTDAFIRPRGSRPDEPEPASPQRAEHLILPSYHEEEEYVPPAAPMRAPPPLSRTSSVLDRLRSLGIYNFLAAADQPATTPAATTYAEKQPPAPGHAHYDRSRSEPAAKKEKKLVAEPKMAKSSSSSTTRKPAAGPRLVPGEEDCVDARAEAFIDSFRKEQSLKKPVQAHHHEDDDEHGAVVPPPPAPLARTSSVLDRLRSFSLYLRSGDVGPGDTVSDNKAADEKAATAQYARSRSEPGKKEKAPQQARMSKTGSEANIAEETAPAEECVNARADDFINKFRQQLQLQRLNSLLSYGKQ